MPMTATSSSLPTRVRPWDLVAFDFDGTLVDSFDLFLDVHNALAGRHGFARIEPHQVEDLRRLDARGLVRHLKVPNWRLPLIVHQARRIMAERRATANPFPGAVEALRGLHADGVRLALLTSNARHTCEQVLGPRDWALFEETVCGVSLFGKAAKLARLAHRAGVPPARMLYVGDQLGDGEAARAAGMDFAAVAWGYMPLSALEACGPRVRLYEPADIARLGGATR
jgi:phosphoglycolate phosphatase